MTVNDLHQRLIYSINEARMSAMQDFGTVELVGLTSVHVATLLEAAVPFLKCQITIPPLPEDAFLFMGIVFRVTCATGPGGTKLWWRLRAFQSSDPAWTA